MFSLSTPTLTRKGIWASNTCASADIFLISPPYKVLEEAHGHESRYIPGYGAPKRLPSCYSSRPFGTDCYSPT